MEVVTTDYIGQYTVSEDLYNLCQEEPAKVTRMGSIVEAKMWMTICKDQFLNSDGKDYSFPEDLKQVEVMLITSLYIFTFQNGNSIAGGVNLGGSESIDDYSISEKRDYQIFGGEHPLSYFGIPVDNNTLAILAKYQPAEDPYGFWAVLPH